MVESSSLKEYAVRSGAHLVGVAPVDRFDQAPDGRKPGDLLPKAASVVVVAMRIPSTVFRPLPSWQYNWINPRLYAEIRTLAYKVAVFLEDNGHEALPMDPAPPDAMRDLEILSEATDTATMKVRFMASFSDRHAALMAGLGELSAAAYLVTPRFGPRVRLASVITTAELKPDAPLKDDLTWGQVCKPDVCGMPCVTTCPAQALPGDGTIDHFKCRHYRGPTIFTEEYFRNIVRMTKEGVSPLQRVIRGAGLSGGLQSAVETCGICLGACPVGLTI